MQKFSYIERFGKAEAQRNPELATCRAMGRCARGWAPSPGLTQQLNGTYILPKYAFNCRNADVLRRPPIDTSSPAVAAVQPPLRSLQPALSPLLDCLLRAAVFGRKLGRAVSRKAHLGGDAVAVSLQPVVPHGKARKCFLS